MEDKYQTVFQTLYDFTELISDPDWHKFITKENITNVIEKSSKIEHLCKRLEDKGLEVEFNNKLQAMWIANGIHKNIEISYFKNSCNIIISKILIDAKIEDDIAISALKAYVVYKSKPELDVLLRTCCKNYNLFLLLSSLPDNPCKEIDLTAVNLCNVMIRKLKADTQESRKEVSDTVLKLIQENMNRVFEIILFQEENFYFKILKQIIFKNLYMLLFEGREDIWNHILNSEHKYVQSLIDNHEILKLILFRIGYSIKHLKCSYEEDNYRWVADKTDCLNFENIIKLLNIIYPSKDGEEINNLLDKLRSTGHRVIVEDIIRELKK